MGNKSSHLDLSWQLFWSFSTFWNSIIVFVVEKGRSEDEIYASTGIADCLASRSKLKESKSYSSSTRKNLGWITTIVVMIFTASALLLKWALIQPLHHDFVSKFLNNESLSLQVNPICKLLNNADYNLIMFPFSCLLILIFIILIKRTSWQRNCCHGNGAVPIPLDFHADKDRKLVAVVFAISATNYST